MSERSAKDVVDEMFRRQHAGDDSALDDLVAADMVNHAAGPQGREGLKRILGTIDVDLGPVVVEQHHLIGEGDLVAQHLTLRGVHRASTMALLADATAPADRRRGGSSTSGASPTD
jgi:ketosteroid isomerase-like protein